MACNKESVFLKVDSIEPVFKGGGLCSREERLDSVKVRIGEYSCFFPCDHYSVCNPDAAVEDGRRQVVELIKELAKMKITDKDDLFGYCTTPDILIHSSYDEIVEKLDNWKKEKIRVRDEVYHKPLGERFVVTKIFVPSGGEDAIINGIKKDGTTIKGLLLCNVKKTGVHVDDLDAYLEM